MSNVTNTPHDKALAWMQNGIVRELLELKGMGE